ncbi:MAG: 23S rRNA (uracil(1939)-C(5))-methyltransferase, partial [Gammaproteobacteria bacterium]|nr:23S rRNA (uracil(1939)-C(5))-methyltransferase [Gammaproteobacteria bacterium]
MKTEDSIQATVADLSHDGRGVVKVEGRVYFVPGVLPDEQITFKPRKKRRGQFAGELTSIDQPSPDRVEPACRYFGVCGGCTLQHLSSSRQLDLKQKQMLDALERIGRVVPREIMVPLAGPAWGYRRKARPGCKYVEKKGGILVGFREQGTSYLTSLKSCETLRPELSALLSPLHELIGSLNCYKQVPQIEMAAADNGVALVIRHLVPLTNSDR